MRREYFGSLAGNFSDSQLARLVVIASECRAVTREFLRGRLPIEALELALESVASERSSSFEVETRLQVVLSDVRQTLFSRGVRSEAMSVMRARLEQLWNRLWLRGVPPYSLTMYSVARALDRQWLVSMLHKEPLVVSVMFGISRTYAGRWDWPLKIGVPDTEKGRGLYGMLVDARYRYLFEPTIVGEESGAVDLLLLPGSLGTANSLNKPGQVTADAVLVLGGAELAPVEANKNLSSLISRYKAGLSGVCFVPRGERKAWVQSLVRGLSHNLTLPDAAFVAMEQSSRREEGGDEKFGNLAAPLLLGDPVFVRSTTIASAAQRFAEALMEKGIAEKTVQVDDGSALVKTAGDLGRSLIEGLDVASWSSERGDATTFVKLRKAVEKQIGPVDTNVVALRLSDIGLLGIAELPLENRSERKPRLRPVSIGLKEAMSDFWPAVEDRFVQAKITPLNMRRRNQQAEVTSLEPLTDYRLRIHIGHPKGGGLIADAPLDTSELPINRAGHDVRLVYCPLSPVSDSDGRESIPSVMQANVHLPQRGDSNEAEFVLRTGVRPSEFRSRLIVAFENRVLQTLLIRSTGDDSSVVIEHENVYSSAFRGNSVDISFVVNDNTVGESGIATLAGQAASFVEPPGLKDTIDQIRELLSDRAAKCLAKPRSIDKDTVESMIELANFGATLVFELRQQHPVSVFESANTVQVVEALDKAYLPVECFYSGEAPVSSAALCPNAVRALKDSTNAIHKSCEHRGDNAYVCPAAFWGFSKCIERLPSNAAGHYSFAEPSRGSDRLRPIDAALVAASSKATREMSGKSGVPTVVSKSVKTVVSVTSWADWIKQLQAFDPGLLILLPHSDNDPNFSKKMPALEVSGDWLPNSQVAAHHVLAGSAPPRGALVMLLP